MERPNVFRHDGQWYMLYVAIRNEVGYETRLAASVPELRPWLTPGHAARRDPGEAGAPPCCLSTTA